MTWQVRFGGFIVCETEDYDEAMDAYRAAGPYGTIREVTE